MKDYSTGVKVSEEKTVVTIPMNERHLSALEFVKRAIGFSTNVDAMRRAVIDLARANGWQDPQPPAPAAAQTSQKGKRQ